MIRLGLTQRVETVPGREERRDCLDQAWTRLLVQNAFRPVPLPNGASDAKAWIDELGLEGVILTGGNDLGRLPGATNAAPERDRFESRLLEACAERGLPVLGVCRGLQMLVSAAGGELQVVEDHVATRHGITARPRRGIPLADRDEVNSFHRFGIPADAVGRDLEAVAFAPDGSIEAVVHRSLPHWGIMWHPERSPQHREDLELLRALFSGRKG
jgi:putative glutamine amidotransferase